MQAKPFYHIRPNKFIDRQLFIRMLGGLSKKFPLKDYQYIGFGSFMFDDFKMIHNQIGIYDMISLESDAEIFKRAKFNKPYNCIELKQETSTKYITDLSVDKSLIFWLDYSVPSEIGSQFADFSLLLNKVNAGDIIRITLNANPSSLSEGSEQEHTDEIYNKRADKFMEKVDKEYIPYADIDNINNWMSRDKYPKLLLRCLKKTASKILQQNPYQNKRIIPLFSSIYADGQQMVTLTSLIIEKDEATEDEITKILLEYDYVNFKWDEPSLIKVPALTAKEILHINQMLPAEASFDVTEIEKIIGFSFPDKSINSYIDYYKYYPNFHHVNL